MALLKPVQCFEVAPKEGDAFAVFRCSYLGASYERTRHGHNFVSWKERIHAHFLAGEGEFAILYLPEGTELTEDHCRAVTLALRSGQ